MGRQHQPCAELIDELGDMRFGRERKDPRGNRLAVTGKIAQYQADVGRGRTRVHHGDARIHVDGARSGGDTRAVLDEEPGGRSGR